LNLEILFITASDFRSSKSLDLFDNTYKPFNTKFQCTEIKEFQLATKVDKPILSHSNYCYLSIAYILLKYS